MSVERARQLRKNSTQAEKRLWSYLRTLKARGFHFRRQAPIGHFIVDFCCHGARIIVEVDGGQHGLKQEMINDASRTQWLEDRGYRVVRFWNNEVLENLDGVTMNLELLLHPHPNPSPQWGGA